MVMAELLSTKQTSTILFGKGAMQLSWEHVVSRCTDDLEQEEAAATASSMDKVGHRRVDFTGLACREVPASWEAPDRRPDFVAKVDTPCELCLMVGDDLQADSHVLADCYANPKSAKIGTYRQCV